MDLNKLKDLVEESRVFIDSNIFTYDLVKNPSYFFPCKDFFERIENGEIHGAFNSIVFSETTFNFIKSFVAQKHKIKKVKKILPFILNNIEILKDIELTPVVELFSLHNLEFLQIPKEDLFKSKNYIKQNQLLTNDSIILSTMKAHDIKDIATNDSDFERVKGIKIWKP